MEHAAEFRRCLLEVDVAGIRRLHHHVDPHAYQPKTDDEALISIHLARMKLPDIPPHLKRYSEAWLKERETGKVALAVGIAVGMHADSEPRRVRRALITREAMESAVLDAVKEGVDLATESAEVQRRILRAREGA